MPWTAGTDSTTAEGLVVLLGDPALAGTAPGDTDAGATYHWRQIKLGSEPWVKLSHIDHDTTMFIAPDVTEATVLRFGLTRNAETEDTVDVTVVPLGADSPSNTTFIDGTLSVDTTDTYNPVTRLATGGSYKAQKSTFRTAFYPLPTAGWRYVWREGTYSYSLNGASCWAAVTPVVRIEGTNAATGTATAPVQFKTYKNGTDYETVTIDLGGHDCNIVMLFWVAGSSYVIVEGFTLTGTNIASNTGRVLYLGGSGWGGGGVNHTAAPVHHVTVRHIIAHDTAIAPNFRGAFYVPGPSHEVAFQYVTSHHGGGGIELGVQHTTVKADLPYNLFIHTALLHDHYTATGNSNGATYAGCRNTATYRAVAYRNSDAGFNTQGPHMDSNTWWDVVSFAQDGELAPTSGGNERGHQVGTISPTLATNSPFWRAAAYNRVYRFIAYDNMGNGLNDVGGSVDGRYYHLTIFNNCLHDWAGSYSGVICESHAGDGSYPGSPAPGATVTNAIVFHTATADDLFVSSGAVDFTTLVTNRTTDPTFVVATPTIPAASALTTDTTMYTNAAQRIVNPTFGVVSGLKLQASSAAINAGTFVTGVHAPTADDDPSSPWPADDPNVLHWRGSAPDQGAYEFVTDTMVGQRVFGAARVP